MSVREYVYAVTHALVAVSGFLVFLEILQWLAVR